MKRERTQAILVAALVAVAAFGAALLQEKGLHYKVLAGREELIKSMDETSSKLVPASEQEFAVLSGALSVEAARGITVDRRAMTITSGADDERDAPRFEWQARRDQVFKIVTDPAGDATRGRPGAARPVRSSITTYVILPLTPGGQPYGVVGVAVGEGVNPLTDPSVEQIWPKHASRGGRNLFLWIDSVDKPNEEVEPVSQEFAPIGSETEHALAGWSAWQDESPRIDKCINMIFSCGPDRTQYVLQYRQKKAFGRTWYQHRWRKERCGC